jgi:hypothetical protein
MAAKDRDAKSNAAADGLRIYLLHSGWHECNGEAHARRNIDVERVNEQNSKTLIHENCLSGSPCR